MVSRSKARPTVCVSWDWSDGERFAWGTTVTAKGVRRSTLTKLTIALAPTDKRRTAPKPISTFRTTLGWFRKREKIEKITENRLRVFMTRFLNTITDSSTKICRQKNRRSSRDQENY